eukprot:9875153-Ditylum_brightwellii.AAC.1
MYLLKITDFYISININICITVPLSGGPFSILVPAVSTAANQQSIELIDGICLLFITAKLVAVGLLEGIFDTLSNGVIEILLGIVMVLLIGVAVL